MLRSRLGRLGLLAVGLGIGAAVASTPGTASADDMQISIDGFDLFPTAGNTATAFSTFGDMAIASGVGAEAVANDGVGDLAIASGAGADADSNEGFGNLADATGAGAHAVTLSTSASIFDSAWASGTNTLAESGNGTLDTAVATGTNSEALAGGGSFDTAIASAGKVAEATGSSGLFVVEPAAAAPAAAAAPSDLDPFEDLFGTAGINTWTPTADTDLGALAGGFDTSVDNFSAANVVPVVPFVVPDSDPISDGLYSFDHSAFTADPALGGLPDNGIGDLAVGLDYTLFSAETELGQLFAPLENLIGELLTGLPPALF
jgi:hypothetical protein